MTITYYAELTDEVPPSRVVLTGQSDPAGLIINNFGGGSGRAGIYIELNEVVAFGRVSVVFRNEVLGTWTYFDGFGVASETATLESTVFEDLGGNTTVSVAARGQAYSFFTADVFVDDALVATVDVGAYLPDAYSYAGVRITWDITPVAEVFWQRKIGTDEPTFSRLKKRPITTTVAAVLATPGTPGTPGRPATPARTILVPRTVSITSNDLTRSAEYMARTKYYFETTRFTTAAEFNAAQQAYSDAIAAYNFAAKNITDTSTTTTVYDSVFIPAQPATPAVPGTAGTAGSAAKTLINTNAGFNSSGSTELLPANVALEFVVSRAAVSVYAGFSATQGVVGRRNIVWGFYFERGTFKVVQNSVLVGSFLPFDSGDTFTVVRANGQIRYLRNNLAVAI